MKQYITKSFLFFILLMNSQVFVFSQKIGGVIVDKDTNIPVEYVSIGVVGKDVGTVSDVDGSYSLLIDEQHDRDSIRFSVIGYKPLVYEVGAFKARASHQVAMQGKDFLLNEVIILSNKFKQKNLGYNFTSAFWRAGFKDNKRGYECGVLLKIKKTAFLEKLTCNIAYCSYDSVLYRVNVYKETGKEMFENILDRPIYIRAKVDTTKMSLDVDLGQYNILVEGNTLITLEHIKDMGDGSVFFSSSNSVLKKSNCYYRKTSQGKWRKSPVNIAFSVTAKVEQ